MKSKILTMLLSCNMLLSSIQIVKADDIAYNQTVPEVIIGNDDRKLVTNTKEEIARKIVRLTYEGRDERGRWVTHNGSGVMIAPDMVLTAAHCVYNLKYKEYYQNMKVVLAATSTGESFNEPFGYSVA